MARFLGEAAAPADGRPTVRRLQWWQSIRRRHSLALAILCALCATAGQLFAPWIMRKAVDEIQTGAAPRNLALSAAGLLAVALAAGGFRFAMRRLLAGVSRETEYAIRNDLFALMQRADSGAGRARPVGDLISRATNDVNAVRMMIGPALMHLATSGALAVVAAVLLFSIDARLALIAVMPLPLTTLAVRCFGSAVQSRFGRIQAQFSHLTSAAQISLSAVRVIRAYAQEAADLSRFERLNQECLARGESLARVQAVYYPSLGFLLGLGGLIALWEGSRDVIDGRITIGQFTAFTAYLGMLHWPLVAFGWVANLVERGSASWARIAETLEPAAEVGEEEPPLPPEDLGSAPAPSIEFRNLTFGYADHPVLRDVSFSVPAGRTVVIVGPTGCGKSTLANLLPRLIEPPAGSIFVDGTDVRDIPAARLRSVIAMVPQEPFLFADTVAGNIAFGLPDKRPDGRVLAAATIARLDNDLRALPNGLETQVGERGVTLSGGQRQRVAIARALAVEPSILILDDAFSAVDAATEADIVSGLAKAGHGRTCLVISHRLSATRFADFVVVLDDQGRVAEQGSHVELDSRGGPYAAMWRRQMLERDCAEC
jgi:ATP-binding cassette subfamily B multidrug efflux pump